MSQPKVVPLTSATKKKSPVPPILHSVRQHAKKLLGELLQSLFNNIDDALFEMADRSRSDADQSMYFESMREIRLHRSQIQKSFMSEFYRGFELAFESSDVPETLDFDEAVDNISLVANDDLEVTVAIAGIVSKVTSQHSLQIMQLTKRIDHLAKDCTVTERMNPLGPERLSHTFVAAISDLNIDIKVRIILLKLFERFVMERLAPLYAEANQLLAEAGILTDLKNIMRSGRQPESAARPSTRSSGPLSGGGRDGSHSPGTGGYGSGPGYGGSASEGSSTGGAGYGNQDSPGYAGTGFGVIQRLLAASRGGAASPGVDSTGSISSSDVVAAFSAAQSDIADPIDIEHVPPLLDLRQMVFARAPEITGRENVQLSQSDDDVVNFVGMLFDYILNDRNLAIPMKALIGRLQLPIVKLAVMDKTFFEKSSHPARQLLNELSSAGIGWSSAAELKRDALYNKIESIVLRVMNGFKDNPDLFSELLKDLRGFVNSDSRKRRQVEQRVKDTETGRARTQAAKASVQQLINQKACGMRMPQEIGRFVSEYWSKVLVYACVSGGDHSPVWQRHVQTLDDLLWCLQPLDKLEDVETREAKVGGLIEALKAGMEDISLPGNEAEEQARAIAQHLEMISTNDRAFLEDDSHSDQREALDAGMEVMEEIVLTAPTELEDLPEPVPAEPEYLSQIEKLKEGSWVEFRQDDGEILRCKLATIIEPGGRYIFVNRRGMKVSERSRMGLAVELKRKALTVLEESQVFDRALQAVIGNLRQMHRAPEPATR
ncbi:MAG: DUF1631 domain-containing protein [Pseudomonadales bacterium]